MTRIVLVQDGLDLIPLHAEQQEVDREFSWDSGGGGESELRGEGVLLPSSLTPHFNIGELGW